MLSWQMPLNKCGRKDGNYWIYSKLKDKSIFHGLLILFCSSKSSCIYQSLITILLRYNEVFLIVDTCQAYSMTQKLYSPNILAVGSSLVGEDSLSVSITYCFLKK